MIYGKTKINGCEKIVKRVVLFYNTYKGVLSKPREMNKELRVLFFIKLSGDECKVLDSRFLERQDKRAVLAVQWFSLGDVLAACDADQAADGLAASISHYLLWLQHHRG